MTTLVDKSRTGLFILIISLFSWDNYDKIISDISDVIWIKFEILYWQLLDQIGILKLSVLEEWKRLH